ncbi:hypothetical protein AaE_010070 [Aphanomyces astaci]|uniref:Uncharacterized protein n=1 Tax=Aphanomyces astaci TaxID=112090 RepID=A0A6A4ZVV1_APHAT|nr:hypothetical protein AaE_010070 [Aphanomyces astaci]
MRRPTKLRGLGTLPPSQVDFYGCCRHHHDKTQCTVIPFDDDPSDPPVKVDTSSFRSRAWRRLEAAGGLCYLAFTLKYIVSYAYVLSPSLANDMDWPAYNDLGYSVFLVDEINAKLEALPNNVPSQLIDLFSADATSPRSYASDAVEGIYSSAYGRFIQTPSHPSYEPLGASEQRPRLPRPRSTPNTAGWILIGDRTLPIPARGLSGAWSNTPTMLPLTSKLARNTNWTLFLATNYNDGPVIARSPVERDHEVLYLVFRKLTRFELQYHNSANLSSSESIEFENAMQQRQTVAVKSTPFGRESWTTVATYWNFRNDLCSLSFCALSIVRGDANHLEHYGYDVSMFDVVGNDNSHLVDQYAVFHDQIGPFGSVDVHYVPPTSLRGGVFGTPSPVERKSGPIQLSWHRSLGWWWT